MKKDKDKNKEKDSSHGEPPKIPQVHDLSGRIPMMTDPDLASFLANARRLLSSGNAIQRKTAELLVPLIEEEVSKRLAAKEAAKKTRVSKRKKEAAAPETPDA